MRYMQKTITIILVVITPLLLRAQVKKKALHWFNATQWGWLMGEKQHTYSIQTVTGVLYKKWSAGIGVAFDTYGYRSLPVFADGAYTLAGNKSPLQVYADAGLNIPLSSKNLPHKYPDGDVWNTLHASFYGELGLRYQIALSRGFCIIPGIGFNYKTFKYTETAYTGDVTVPTLNSHYTYRYSKYVLRIGFAIR